MVWQSAEDAGVIVLEVHAGTGGLALVELGCRCIVDAFGCVSSVSLLLLFTGCRRIVVKATG